MVVLACLGAAAGAGAQALDGFAPGANDTVYTIVVQPDQRILVGGAFTMLGDGGTGSTPRQKIGRLNADGSIDTSFNPQANIGINAQVLAIALQADGKVVVAGIDFVNGRNLARLNADGSLDTAFTAAANGPVYALALQADGKIVVGGSFSNLSGGVGPLPRSGIGRLNADGSVDQAFDPGSNGLVRALLVQADGRILVGGSFTTLGGGGTGTTTRHNVGRLDATGALEAGFDPGAGSFSSAMVKVFAIQGDGRILVGGRFRTLGGGGEGTTRRNNLGRLEANGALDPSFEPELREPVVCTECTIPTVESVVVLPNRKILVAGSAVSLDENRETDLHLARLADDDGDLELEFFARADTTVHTVVAQMDGRILLGGEFSWEEFGVLRRLARIDASTPSSHKLVAPDSDSGAVQGFAVALSADGNTAIVGGPNESYTGAAWIWTRSLEEGDGSPEVVWERQGPPLISQDIAGESFTAQGQSVAISADGNTAVVGGSGDDDDVGAAWVWVRSGTTWTEQAKLVGSGATGSAPSLQGTSVAISGDGNTVMVGGIGDGDGLGATWVWTRSGNTWTQQGGKLVGSGSVGALVRQGASVALSSNGSTAIVGGNADNGSTGAAWIWTRSEGLWSQQGPKIVASDDGNGNQGASVSISGDGNTVLVGGTMDSESSGAAWVWTRTAGVWSQQGPKLVGFGVVGPTFAETVRVALSGDGNTAVVGWHRDDNSTGAASVFTRQDGAWAQRRGKLVGSEALDDAQQGSSVGASADGTTIISGGPLDDDGLGAAWVFSTPTATTLAATAVTGTTATLNGMVNANGDAVTASFDLGRTSVYGRSFWVSAEVGPGLTAVPASVTVTGLQCDTLYHVRAVAARDMTTYGSDVTFTTLACAPVVQTLPVLQTQRGPFSATLSATVNPNGTETTLYFDYGLTPTYGSIVTFGSVGAGMTAVTRSLTLGGLTCATTYHYRARADNGSSATGADLTFTTSPCAPTITGITPGNARLQVEFIAGADGGAPLENYQYSLDGGESWITRSPASTASPLVLTGLTNGVTYTVRMRAVNANGTGVESAAAAATPTLGSDEIADVFNPGANGDVTTIVVQADGKILVGGRFTRLGGGGTGSVRRNNIGRLNADGSVDMGFDPGAELENPEENRITAIAVQQDGKIVIAWDGPDPLGIRRRVGRLNPDGSVDENFRSTANNTVLALALQSDGKVLVGGSFTSLGSWTDDGLFQRPRHGIGRLNPDGTLDVTFDPGRSGTVVRALAQQSDGRILVGGSFAQLGPGAGVPRQNIGRLNADGSVDLSFDPGAGGGPQPTVKALSVVSSGILVGGRFATLGGGGTGSTARRNIGRLQPSGALDTSFVPGPGADAESEPFPIVESLLPLPNGQVLLGGYAVAVMGTTRHLARLNADGSLDQGFDPDANGRVNTLAVQPDGKIVVGGAFTSVGGEVRYRLARLGATVPGHFTDDPLIPGVTTLKAVHVYELRAHITEVRRRFNLAEVAWTNPTLAGVLVRAAHIQQLRQALLEAYDAALAQGLTVVRPVFTDDPLTSGSGMRALHIEQLREAVRSLESP
jgi:uncharacterized delta-60 repeat protein